VGAPSNATDAFFPGEVTVIRQNRIGMIAAKECYAYNRIRSGDGVQHHETPKEN